MSEENKVIDEVNTSEVVEQPVDAEEIPPVKTEAIPPVNTEPTHLKIEQYRFKNL